jgi:hypothetical protein
LVRGQERNNRGHVGGLGDPLERLHAEEGGATLFRLRFSMTPGATAFTRIPRGPRMEAKCLTIVLMAPFVAAYADTLTPTAE